MKEGEDLGSALARTLVECGWRPAVGALNSGEFDEMVSLMFFPPFGGDLMAMAGRSAEMWLVRDKDGDFRELGRGDIGRLLNLVRGSAPFKTDVEEDPRGFKAEVHCPVTGDAFVGAFHYEKFFYASMKRLGVENPHAISQPQGEGQ